MAAQVRSWRPPAVPERAGTAGKNRRGRVGRTVRRRPLFAQSRRLVSDGEQCRPEESARGAPRDGAPLNECRSGRFGRAILWRRPRSKRDSRARAGRRTRKKDGANPFARLSPASTQRLIEGAAGRFAGPRKRDRGPMEGRSRTRGTVPPRRPEGETPFPPSPTWRPRRAARLGRPGTRPDRRSAPGRADRLRGGRDVHSPRARH